MANIALRKTIANQQKLNPIDFPPLNVLRVWIAILVTSRFDE